MAAGHPRCCRLTPEGLFFFFLVATASREGTDELFCAARVALSVYDIPPVESNNSSVLPRAFLVSVGEEDDWQGTVEGLAAGEKLVGEK